MFLSSMSEMNYLSLCQNREPSEMYVKCYNVRYVLITDGQEDSVYRRNNVLLKSVGCIAKGGWLGCSSLKFTVGQTRNKISCCIA